MQIFQLISDNLISPPILFFVLGIFSGIIKSDLSVPEQISRYLAIYLMMAIGFKGGVAISQTQEFTSEVIFVIISGMFLGFLQPFLGFWFLRLTTKLDDTTAAATAAHYGSVSMVTFITAVSFLEFNETVYAGYIIAVLALMETPSIISGLMIADKYAPEKIVTSPGKKNNLNKEIFTNGAIMLLLGSFVIGWATGNAGMKKMSGFFVDPFQGILALFLLDMGLLVSKQLEHLKEFTFKMFMFGIYMPVIGASLGLTISCLAGLDLGTATLFTVLVASASYIAVTAAMRIALPKAKAAIYVPMSLAITFPFNVVIGIPVYYSVAQMILK